MSELKETVLANTKLISMTETGKLYRCSFDFKLTAGNIKFIGVDEAANMDNGTIDAIRHATLKKEKKHMFFKKLWKRVDRVYDVVFRKYSDGYGFGIQEQVREIREDINSLMNTKTIDCHTCGCVVRKEIAFRGHDRIEREEVFTATSSWVGKRPAKDHPEYMEVVHETWYCKLHKKGKNEYGAWSK